MYPELLHIGSFVLSTYGVLLALAFAVSLWLAVRASARMPRQRAPLSGELLVDWAGWAMIGGLVGGRALYVMLNWPVYASAPLEIVAIWHGGLVWYGGFAGGMAASVWYFHRHRVAVLPGVDQLIPFVALGHAIGRLGCFANGCCYGMASAAWYGVQFPHLPEPVVPTQLLESLGLAGLYLILRRLQSSARARPGTVFGAYLIGYGLLRWVLEYWRANPTLLWEAVTLSQLISACAVLAGLWLIIRRRAPLS